VKLAVMPKRVQAQACERNLQGVGRTSEGVGGGRYEGVATNSEEEGCGLPYRAFVLKTTRGKEGGTRRGKTARFTRATAVGPEGGSCDVAPGKKEKLSSGGPAGKGHKKPLRVECIPSLLAVTSGTTRRNYGEEIRQ